ncbi:MAG: response regulator [Ectothiorhodospiraceae bacterium]|nr:response regulator [Ectothiorhodospiraceae bacterium]
MATPVLVVDDSTMSRKLTMRALPADWNVELHQASGGEEALALCRQIKPRLMLLDLTMPGMDGFEVLEAMGREGLECVVVVISADIQPKAEARVLELGAVAFLPKPVDAGQLARVLRENGLS